MPNENDLAMSAYRLDQARECLKSAERELEAGLPGSFKTSANRSYYCIFHAMRSVLALESFDSKKHSGVISHFRQKYIKTGLFSDELSNIIKHAFKFRNDSDYQDFYLVSRDDVAAQIEDAKTFITAVEEYLVRVAPEVVTANIKPYS